MLEKKDNQLYVYTNKTYQEKGWIKVGQSQNVKSRVANSKTASPEKLELMDVFDLPSGITDHDIHNELSIQGFPPLKKGGGSEWFEASIDDVRRAFHFLTRNERRAHSFQLRKEQSKAVDQALKWFRGKCPRKIYKAATHKNRFLLNAKMRFGKCFTTISLAKKLGAKNILVITYKPEVLSEWMETVDDHLEFSEWTGIRAKQSKNVKEKYLSIEGAFPKAQGAIVLCVSLQDLSIDSESHTKKRLSKLIKKTWDLVIFDEVHFGGLTGRARGILDKIKYTKRIDLSGTPFRLLEMEDFCREQVYTYSYLDEQYNKKIEAKNKSDKPIYCIFPDIDFSTIEITSEDLDSQLELYRNDDLELSLNKIFESSNSKFLHDQAVDHFIDGLRLKNKSARSVSVYGSLASTLGLPDKRHSVWWVNSVSTARAFVSKLKTHDYFRKFEIINAAGSEKATITEDGAVADDIIAREKRHVISAINKSIKNSHSLGTITITVKRFLTGVTIKEWDSILVLNDIESPEEYYQAIFRIQSPWYDQFLKKVVKPKSWVFDFSVTRCLMMKVGLAHAIASERVRNKKLDRTTKDQLKAVAGDICTSFSLKSYVDGKLVPDKATADDVFSAINMGAARSSLARRITSDAIINFIPLKLLETDKKLLGILKSIKGYRTQDIGAVTTLVKIGKIEDDIDKGRKKRADCNPKGKLTKQQKEMKRQKEWVATQIKRLAISMADFIYMTQEREFCIEEVIETKEASFFKTVTGITKSDFKKLCKIGFIKKGKLNEIVREFYAQEEASLHSEEFVLYQIEDVNFNLTKKA